MEKLLLTGFGPFGSHSTNVSGDAARELEGLEVDGFQVVTRVLPVQFEEAVAELEAALAEEQPAAVLATGIHAGDDGFRVELSARNLRDYELPDAAGQTVRGAPVAAGAPPMGYGRLPVAALKAALEEAGFEASLSEDAGAYLCNAIFFWLCQQDVPAGFVHLPAATEPGEASRGLQAVLGAVGARLAAQRVEATA